MSKQWGGRFQGKTDALVERLGESVSFDARLAPWDIRASIAHARMLGDCGIISKADSKRIISGLKSIAKDIDSGNFSFDSSLEDVHTNIEVALVKRIGEAGRRLHTARSRNDQIATDTRLWARDQIDRILELLRDLQLALLEMAEKHIEVILPGFTHLQHAQPVSLAHHLLAYIEMVARDRERFQQTRQRVNVLPLGSAALAGTPHRIDRNQVARELGFDSITRNSMDAVSDRDYLLDFCFAGSTAMMHLSRMAEELVLWSTSEFSFIEIGDAFTTGSSIMPQKKNPDVAELVRGKTGRVYGSLVSLLTMMKGLPLTYNRDMQEDKEPAFNVSDTVQLCLQVMSRMIPSIRFDIVRMMEASKVGFTEATDVADYLVRKGVPFREAHGIVGRIVIYCVQSVKQLPDMGIQEYRQFSNYFEGDIFDAIQLKTIVQRRKNTGGTAFAQVRAQIKRLHKTL